MKATPVKSIWPERADYQPYFIERFGVARADWLRRAGQLSGAGRVHSFAHPLRGPEGEALATDSLWLGSDSAQHVAVVIAGTHGIEGYAGSAIQRYLLDGISHAQIKLPENAALLLVHALTPWGMAWYRRCDEQGIDLNRHFVNLLNPPDNPGFEKLRPLLDIEDTAARRQALETLAQKLGRRVYEEALSGGQYVDPLAPFYGGQQPNHGRLVMETLIVEHRLFERDLCVLDLHTGLGSWGYGELICDHAPGSAGTQAALRRFGPGIAQPALGTSSSVPKHGLLDYAWHSGMNARSCFLTLEFSTYSTQALFDRLIDDHRYWAAQIPCGFSDDAWRATRMAMLEHFFPCDPDWRQAVALRSLQLLRRALEPT